MNVEERAELQAKLLREERARNAQLVSALKAAEQGLIEVAAAQERGANWYTRGADGLYDVVRRHTLSGLAAIKACSTSSDAGVKSD